MTIVACRRCAWVGIALPQQQTPSREQHNKSSGKPASNWAPHLLKKASPCLLILHDADSQASEQW